MSSYRSLLLEAQKQMVEANRGEQAALFYLVELTNMESHSLYMEMDQEVDEALATTYKEGIKRLIKGEPLAHVIGYESFFGYRFTVNPDVLIPRPETEELVVQVLAAYDELFLNEQVVVADVGTGSGAIAITLKKEEPKMHLLATDISPKALQVARDNAKALDACVTFLEGSMLEPLIDRDIKLDILVSNPPYIKKDAVMEDCVVDYEPHVALFGGEDGLYFYRMILENAHLVLKPKALIAFEMGYDEKEELVALAKHYYPNERIEVVKDMSNKDRMLLIYINE